MSDNLSALIVWGGWEGRQVQFLVDKGEAEQRRAGAG